MIPIVLNNFINHYMVVREHPPNAPSRVHVRYLAQAHLKQFGSVEVEDLSRTEQPTFARFGAKGRAQTPQTLHEWKCPQDVGPSRWSLVLPEVCSIFVPRRKDGQGSAFRAPVDYC